MKYNFSGLWPESTYFPDAARPAKTYFLATAAEKFYTILDHKTKNDPNRSLPSSASPGKDKTILQFFVTR